MAAVTALGLFCFQVSVHGAEKVAGKKRWRMRLTIQAQEVGGGQQLQTQVNGYIHICHILLVPESVPINEVLDHLFEDQRTIMQ